MATFVPLKGTTTWRRHHTKPYKFGQNVFPKTSHMNYRTGLVLGEGFCIFIFWHFPDSGLSVLTGLNFFGLNSENTGAELTYVGRYVGKIYTKETSCNSFPCKVWWLECEQLFLDILRGMYGKRIRSLSNNDGDIMSTRKEKKQYVE